MMKQGLVIFLTLCFGVNLLIGDEELTSGEKDSGYYLFLGADLRAKHKSGLQPIMSANRRGIFIDTEKGLKRVPWKTPCTLAPKISLSGELIAIEDVSYDFVFRKRGQLESNAMRDQQRMESGTEVGISKLNAELNMNPNMSDDERDQIEQQISDLRDNQQDFDEFVQDEIDGDKFDSDTLDDSIYLSMNVTPTIDLKNAFCAMVITFKKYDQRAGKVAGKGVIVRVWKMGDLMADIPSKVKMDAQLVMGVYDESTFEFFMFNGDGKPIATNLSRGLQMLTVDQLKEFRERQSS